MDAMGSPSTQRPPCSSATAAANPQCMLLAPYGGGVREDCNITGDTKTMAAAVTSTGHRISVSLRRQPSPALSRICLRQSACCYSTVIAAHGGSVLLQILSPPVSPAVPDYGYDYFVYRNAVAVDPAPARPPPSLYLLPKNTSTQRWPPLDLNATGLLCHGEAEFVVAELKIPVSKHHAAAAVAASPTDFELHLFHNHEWCVKRPLVVGKDGDLIDVGLWEPLAVVTLGNGLLCWVDQWAYGHRCGVIFSNVLDESPELRYVPYPAEALMNSECFVCTNARGALKLVSLSPPRRCSHCGCSEHATAIDTWALNTDDMAWVLGSETMVEVDSSTDKLWALETMVAPEGYARVHLGYHVASMNDSGHEVVRGEISAPNEEEVENTAGKGTRTGFPAMGHCRTRNQTGEREGRRSAEQAAQCEPTHAVARIVMQSERLQTRQAAAQAKGPPSLRAQVKDDSLK